ncbi:MAG: GAF domain-containing protein [Acidimicrobiia bacterium]
MADLRDLESKHQLDALHHLAVELSGLRSVDSVLDVALRHCLDLTGSQFGFIGLGGIHPEAMEIAAIHGFHPSPDFFQRHRLIPLRPNVFANAGLENRPVRSADATVDPGRVGQPAGHPQVTTFLGVPLRLNDEPIGMIGVANRPEPYTDDHERLLLTYAGQVAIVIDNAQLYERLERANEQLERTVQDRTAELARVLTETVDAQELERNRIARDLHDGVSQLLIGAMLELTSGRRRLERGSAEESLPSLEAAQELLRRVESEIRRVVHDLHPQALEGLGLAAASRRLLDEYADQSGVETSITIDGDLTTLPARCEVSAYRILQESIHNVASHANARRVSVTLGVSENSLTMEVADDGRGFDPDVAVANGHLGLRSMRQRAEMLHGTLEIDSGAGRGTTVRALIPIR